MEIKKILEFQPGTKTKARGWVRFNRVSKNIGFITLFDGSSIDGIQLVYKAENESVFEKLSSVTQHSSIIVSGTVVEARQGGVEIEVNEIESINLNQDEKFPIGKKEHGLEFLRDVAHLRPKTKLFQSIMKVRSVAGQAIHEYFANEGWINVHAPIITGNDAEGAGEAFYITTSDGKTFWDKQASLTVSGQLHAEGYAQAMGKVYTFGPTFRAENSNTTRHANEFWMMEPEAAFYDYQEMMTVGEENIKFASRKVLELCRPELELLSKYFEKDLFARIENIISKPFERISYTKAIELLQQAVKDGAKFEVSNIEFGIDLGSEHEKYLSEQIFKGPVYVHDYPSKIKSFYMYQNGDGTCRGFDLLVPGIGELIGGSERETRYDVLLKTIEEKGLNKDEMRLDWYIDLRRQGYSQSSGYGLGFERFVMLLTGVENIRDVLPFPRTPGKINY